MVWTKNLEIEDSLASVGLFFKIIFPIDQNIDTVLHLGYQAIWYIKHFDQYYAVNMILDESKYMYIV